MADVGLRRKRRRTTLTHAHAPLPGTPPPTPAAAAARPSRPACAEPLHALAEPPCRQLGDPPLRLCPPPDAAVSLELLRAKAVRRLRKRLHALCAAEGLEAPPQLAFERWRFAALRAEEEAALAAAATPAAGGGGGGRRAGRRRAGGWSTPGADPLLPSAACGDTGGGGGAALAADLRRAGLGDAACERVAAALAAASAEQRAAVAALAQRLHSAGGDAARGGDAPVVAVEASRRSVSLSCRGAFVLLSLGAYAKLSAMHRAHAPPGERAPADPPADGGAAAAEEEPEKGDAGAGDAAGGLAAPAPAPGRAALHSRLFALLLRYKTIHGAGFQAAAPPGVLALLRASCGVSAELFASPLNARWGRFCSAFPDTDAPFGSAGSFFRLAAAGQPSAGAYWVNPPFTASLCDGACDALLGLLASAEAARRALLFAVVLPGWGELRSLSALSASPRAALRCAVAAGAHGFVDGAAHQKSRDLVRPSPYDSVLLLLQTSAAPPLPPGLEARLRDAMAAARPGKAAGLRAGRE